MEKEDDGTMTMIIIIAVVAVIVIILIVVVVLIIKSRGTQNQDEPDDQQAIVNNDLRGTDAPTEIDSKRNSNKVTPSFDEKMALENAATNKEQLDGSAIHT